MCGSHQEIGQTVAIGVSRAGHRKTQEGASKPAADHESFAGAAGREVAQLDVLQTGLAIDHIDRAIIGQPIGVALRCGDGDVVIAITIEVTQVGDLVAAHIIG